MGVTYVYKIKLFVDDTLEGLERKVNRFIKDKSVRDVKFFVSSAAFYVCVFYQARKED